MSTADQIIQTVLDSTNTDKVLTYPGTPPRQLYKAVEDSEADLVQGVREQHLPHLAQTLYYKSQGTGEDKIPVIIVSGGMGEAMMSQAVIAGSITCPMLILVAETGFEHVENGVNIAHQTDRGKTSEKIKDKDILKQHENVSERILLKKAENHEKIREITDSIKETKSIGIIHVPIYSYTETDLEIGEKLSQPEKTSKEELGDLWRKAEKPFILAGRGAIKPETRNKIEKIAAETGAPIGCTMPAEGFFQENYVGRVGLIGTPTANQALLESDLVLALGTSLQSVVTSHNPKHIMEFKSKTVQVEKNSLRKSVFADKWINTSVEKAVSDLTEKNFEGDNWFDKNGYNLEKIREEIPDALNQIGELIREEYPDKTINLGVGNAGLWMAWAAGPEIKKDMSRTGSMGETTLSLTKEENPLLVLGDGELEMDLSLLTEAQYQCEKATIIVVNNQRLGLVTEFQEKEFGEIITPKQNPINYEGLGEGFENIESYSLKKNVKESVKNILEEDEISIIEIKTSEKLSPKIFDVKGLPTP